MASLLKNFANQASGGLLNPLKKTFSGLGAIFSNRQAPVKPTYGPQRPNPVTVAQPSTAQVSVASPSANPTVTVNPPQNNQQVTVGSPVPVPPVAPAPASMTMAGGQTQAPSGFTSADPAVQARIAEMNRQTQERSSQAPTAPTLPTTSDGKNINPATGGISELPTTVPNTGIPSSSDLLKAIFQNSQLSPEEMALNRELNASREATDRGVYGEGQRPIARQFFTGRQASIQQAGALDENSIVNRLALAQAERQGKLGAFKNLFDAIQPTSVAEGTTLINPITGEVVRQGVSSGDTQAQNTFYSLAQTYPDANVQYDPTKTPQENLAAIQQAVATAPSFLSGGSSSEGGLTENQVLTQAQKLVSDGYFDSLDAAINAVSSGDYSGSSKSGAEGSALKDQALGSAMELMNKFINREGTSAVGGSRVYGFQLLPGTASRDFQTQFDNLKALLSLDNVQYLKGQGQVSDAERKLLADSSAKLDLAQSEPEFEAALKEIITALGGNSAGGATGEFDFTTQQGIDSFLETFSNDLSTSVNGSEIGKIANAIGQYESGGNYNARGPVVESGQYKGERALGKYQIMPGNLPSWSRAALGKEVTEQEFLNNPRIQDAIAQYKMQELYNKYGTVEDVASAWFSGQPLARAGNRQDVLGTTVPSYVKNVVSIFNNLG